MANLKLAKPGLSYADANSGRLITIEQDVLDIKGRIQERWPQLEVLWDKDQMEWVVIEHCLDEVDRLVFSSKILDERVIQRLERADTHVRGQEDPDALCDAYNEELEKDNERKFADQMGDFGERLTHAFKKDGLIVAPKVSNYIPNR